MAQAELKSTAASTHATHRKVLVILSSADELDMRDGKKFKTGVYLDELVVPLRKIVAAGFTPVFANPKGNAISIAPESNNKMFFGGDDAVRAEAANYVESIAELRRPKTFAEIIQAGTEDFVGIFIPGGHAPMQDLVWDQNLGKILVAFHEADKPTAVLCHGSVALLSAVPEAEGFRRAMIAGDFQAASTIAAGWPYAGYRLTVFSSAEEMTLEARIGGRVMFHAADALAEAGAHVDRVAAFHPNVIQDRELISGQQPFSSEGLGDAFIAKLRGAP
jgi:putative intracellular protease/amidase